MAKQLIPLPHPGEILLEDFLKPMGLTQYQLAKATGLDPATITRLVQGKQSITADIDIRLHHFFGTSTGLWLGLQSDYDIRQEKRLHNKDFLKIKPWTSLQKVRRGRPKAKKKVCV